MIRAFPNKTKDDMTDILRTYLRKKSSKWEGWDDMDMETRIKTFWNVEDSGKGTNRKSHTLLRRGILKSLQPTLNNDIKLDLLYRLVYPLQANPYEINVDDYVSILQNYTENTRSESQGKYAHCLNGQYEKSDILARNILVGTLVVAVFCSVQMVHSNMVNEKTRRYDESDPESDKRERQARRGSVASIMISLSFGLLNFLVDRYGDVNAATSTAMIGLGFGGTLGFLMDNTIGSDKGFQILNEQGPLQAWKYALGLLMTGAYLRYVLTVLLDTFITLILFKPLFVQVCALPFFRCGNQAIANGLVSTIIGIITFQAYANSTRFAWAYPPVSSQTNDTWLRGSTMQLCISLASVMFLISNTQVTPGEMGINQPTVKLVVVLSSFILVCMVSSMGVMEDNLRVAVVPDNVIQALSKSGSVYAAGDIVNGDDFEDVHNKHNIIDEDVIVNSVNVISDGETIYKLIRKTPRFKYDYSKIIDAYHVSERSHKGALYLTILGTMAFGVTVIGTSSRVKRVRNNIFLVMVALTALIASPGVFVRNNLK